MRITMFLARVFTGIVLVFSTVATQAQEGRFVDRVYRDADGDHEYAVFLPAGYSDERAWPTILFLHGAGERGTDGRLQTTIGLGPYAKARADSFRFIAVFPQCEDLEARLLTAWSAGSPDGKRALAILDHIAKSYRVDESRTSLVGWSMGGYGAWSLGAAHPDRFSAVVPIAGGGDPETVAPLTDVPVWAIHGENDKIVPVEESREMVEALRGAGGDPAYTEIAGGGHLVYRVVFGSDAFYNWLLDPETAPPEVQAVRVKPGVAAPPAADEDQPFLPALEIPRAVYLRLGNDLFSALSQEIPEMVSPEMLRGRINNIYDSTVAQGRSFSVTLAGISYSAELQRAAVQAYTRDRLNVQLGLRNAVLTIGGASIRGQRHGANTGPINVVIGHRRPVWLSIDVTPYIEQGRIRLRTAAARFNIPNDNWYVTSPSGISAWGVGLTEERVASSLVNGLYGRKNRIEQEVLNVVPRIVSELEQQLKLTDAGQIVSGLWPLPVYQPRLRVWPQQITTDKTGVSLLLGVTAAALDQTRAPERPQRAPGADLTLASVPQSTSLEVGVGTSLLTPLTRMLIDQDLARINVLDIPEESFHDLARPEVLAKVVPDAKRHGDYEVWAELILAEPVRIGAAEGEPASSDSEEGNASGSNTFLFELPSVLISLAIRQGPEADWQPLAEFDLHVAQRARVRLPGDIYSRRSIQLDWTGAPQITGGGRFAPGYEPETRELADEELIEWFRRSWVAWTESEPVAKVEVPDVNFDSTLLRLAEVGFAAPALYGRYASPGIRLTNRSSVEVQYEMKGPTTGWGGPYALAPGRSHNHQVAYPLTFRRRTSTRSEHYTLAVGSRFEFRVPKEGGEPALLQPEE